MTQDRYHSFRIVFQTVFMATALLFSGIAAAQVHVQGNVYGGGNLATVGGSVEVNISAGTVDKDVYGGGALANTNINNVTNGYGTENETISSTTTNTTTVNLMGGTINGDAYGGGLGRKESGTSGQDGYVSPVEAKVYGDITVNLGNADASISATKFNITKYPDDGYTDVVKSGRVFGANNLNGSPLGNVTVNVYKTVKGNIERTASGDLTSEDATKHKYEVAAVYGGGNLANYTTADKMTSVNILTCDVSVESVYGGGNAAAVPKTEVVVSGAYEIQYVFGGGNGKDPYKLNNTWNNNPGADVLTDANTLLTGGYIHEAYGGSNEKGTIGGSAVLRAEDASVESCPLNVVKMVGAGKNADINGNVIMVLGCMPDQIVDEIYGGADNANVNGNVELTITSGNFGNVYGGNNLSGIIKGHIILNIEETGCIPINIDKLYLGGNQAAYSKYGYYIKTTNEGTADLTDGKFTFLPRTSADDEHRPVKTYDRSDNSWTVYAGGGEDPYPSYDDPILNVISCTRIGNVFGGGYGSTAEMYGNPTVNINMIPGSHADKIKRNGSANAHDLGAIGNVYGGGEEAVVYGKATINIGTASTVTLTSLNTDNTKDVEGAYITGNVFGGGLNAQVEGDTEVNIGTVAYTTEGYEGVSIGGDVYGGGEGASTNVTGTATVNLGTTGETAGTYTGNSTVTGDIYGGSAFGTVEEASVNLYQGTVRKVFGGGKGYNDDPDKNDDSDITAHVTSGTSVTLYGATVTTALYGGSNLNGEIGTSSTAADANTATVTLLGGSVGNSTYDSESNDWATVNAVFGGGLGTNTHTYGLTTLEVGSKTTTGEEPSTTTTYAGAVQIYGNIYGGSENGEVKTVAINLYGDSNTSETIHGNVYGGGYQTTEGETAATDVNVTLDGATFDLSKTGIGQVFGCNNIQGTPIGHVKVEVKSTGTDGTNGYGVANVFGGGNQANYNPAYATANKNLEVVIDGSTAKIGQVFGGGNQAGTENTAGTDVTLSSGHVVTAIYGGNNASGTVVGNTSVAIIGGVVGTDWDKNVPAEMPQLVFGGGLGQSTFVGGTVTVNIGSRTGTSPDYSYSGSATIWGDVYGGSAKGKVNTTDGSTLTTGATTNINLYGGILKGDLYGGGLGDNTPSSEIAANVYGPVTVTTEGGKARNVFGCNNKYGAPQNTVAVNINGTDADLNELDETAYAIGNVYGGGNQAAYTYTESPLTVTMAGGIVNNVFGGGLSAEVAGSIAVNVTGGEVVNDVYGGGALAHTNTANWNQGSDPLLKYVEVTGLTVGTTSVAGYYTKSGDVYTLITKMDKAAANTTYYKKTVGGTWASSHPYTTTVDLTGGVVGNVYGGGLGQLAKAAVAAIGTEGQEGYQPAQAAVPAVEANVYGDVTVTVNDPTKLAARLGITAAAAENLASTGGVGVAFTQRRSEKFTIGNSTTEHTVNVTGNVFGCNNLNGTPTGDVTVHVYSTRQLNDNGVIIAGHTPSEIGNENEKYEIQGVYGGGNLADYLPADGKKTNVLIDGCGITSIKKVFGGGNSALVPATDVTITGSHAIGYAFGGGNGGDYIKKNGVWQDNEGAIVIGTASIACHGGKVGSVFGGSDARGVCGGTNINTEASQEGAANYCALKITRIYGAGNEADVTGNVNTIISGCTSEQVEFVHGGSYNAHVSGDVTLTITSGILQNVYGGNDARGSIGGNITVNIEETETSCHKPIIIQNLVGGGNNAPYPGITREGVDLSQNENWHGNITVNVKSATRIDNVYGGCFNAQANADTEVNINMLKGKMAGYSENVSIPKRYYDGVKPTIPNITYVSANGTDNIWCKIKNEIGTIGNVFGGGKEGKVVGNTTVNIGTASTVGIMARNDDGDILNTSNQVISYTSGQNMGNVSIQYSQKPVLGANVTENVYGGGELADVTGNTFVNICAKKVTNNYSALDLEHQHTVTIENESVTVNPEGVSIAGNVFGGGKGKADNFFCNKAMVGVDGDGAIDADKDGNPDHPEGGTTVVIGNGTVNGNVYGGGEIARVEKNSDVTIGLGAGVASGTPTSAPIIGGDVFGAGKGIETHGYSALVRGNPSVTVQANAKVNGSVYGGGEIGSVARYKVVNESPVALENNWSGNCVVKVQGYAEIGPEDNMTMPTFSGNVFGAGKGVLPVDYFDGGQTTSQPKRMISDGGKNSWQYFDDKTAYFSFIQTLALASQTSVTVSDHAFVKGSVYGGSENGIVQYDTHVQIQDHCQIGCGANATLRFDEANFIDPSTATVSVINAAAAAMEECAHWPYGEATAAADKYAPYDKYAGTAGYDSRGGRATGDDGHTFYGNVFGGGSGYFPYAPGKWHRAAGLVRGNTVVDITGGHILTSVYGGNEQTDVGTYTEDENTHEPIVYVSGGKCTVNFGGTATLGVPRTRAQIIAHPVTCYLFGSGKGDTRTFFNTWTNVNEVEVNVTGGIIYGSVFGGGEDGHVLGDVKVNISDNTSETSHKNTKIGTWGTSYVDGNVFGAGRGFIGDALTAGSIGGNVTMNISGGTMLGSVYGGGRLASVGIGFTDPLDDYYGQLIDDVTGDNPKTYGHITMNIIGGTIGNENATGDGAEHSGNVFGGSMGRITLLNGNDNPLWPKLAVAKITSVNISQPEGKTTLITRNVYGGSEFGIVRDQATVTISGGTVNGNVFGGGYGSKDTQPVATITPAGYPGHYYTFTPMTWSGCVSGNTTVNISGGTVKKNVYGGGELASVGLINFESDAQGNYIGMTKHADPATGFALSWPYEFHYIPANPSSTAIGGKATVKITGSSIIGTDNNDDTGYVFGGSKGKVAFNTTDDIDEQRYTEAFCANVRETEVIIGTSGGSDNPQIRTVYGGGEDGHVYKDAKVTLHRGTIGHSIFGGGKGETPYTTTLWDPNNAGNPKNTTELAHSWTAGRVYGNTSVTMNGGSVGWFIYGGGNLASVGKGNYAGGSDDYSTAGYGELPNNSVNSGKLWATSSTAESETKDDAYHFLNSGQSTVTIMGGTVGPESFGDGVDKYIDKDGIPYGSVFGGSRGQAAASVQLSPRYKYVPDFFLGYVNKTIVNIGGTSTTDLGDGPTIKGSVYGGGQDGHVRNSTEVRIFKGNIDGQGEYETAGRSGNVFGAGSGIGTYKDGTTDKCNNSSGSVTCTALVEITGGSITGSVYGGGAMASVGPPKTGQPLDEQKAASGTTKSYSYTKVNMKGGSVGGSVFGASRGPSDTFLAWRFPDNDYDPTKFATDLWSDVIISGGTIGTATTGGNVYGGGETGYVKCGVTVNILGGEITKDVYGGGALAHTNTSNLKQDKTSKLWSWTDTSSKTAKYTTTVNLLGGTIGGDAYGGGLGRKEHGISGQAGYESPVEATVYGDVKVNLNGLETEDIVESVHGENSEFGNRLEAVYGGRRVKDAEKGAIVTRVFGCNNLNGSPQGGVRVHVFGTQNANSEHNTINNKYPVTDHGTTSTYDVQAVYGGANLAPYTPMGPSAVPGTETTITTDYKNTTQRTEVIIDGCGRTSINQVYGGGNAASAPATYVEVNGTHEIGEVFGGGNGADTFILKEGDAEIWHENPGANVGYENYTHWVNSSGSSPGTQTEPYHLAVENSDASTPEARQKYRYGSGVATTAIKGGTIHYVYGGSNKNGNISTTAMSMIEGMDDCTLLVDESYGGGKDAPIDGTIDSRSDCAKGVKELFGGSKNADVNSDVILTITNGSSFERVFGGNNTSGAIAGSITVNIEEGGCEPIIIQELYAGGYLAPYSIYGYQLKQGGGYATEEIDYGGTIGKINQRIPLKSGANPKNDPRINIISATRIDNVFGGGYRALVVGSPHVNVNMTNGKVEVENKGTEQSPVWKDINDKVYASDDVTDIQTVTTGEGQTQTSKKIGYVTLPIGNIGTIYGGGNMADIIGDTHVEIGTGEWINKNGQREMLGTTQDITTPTTFTYDDENKVWKYVSGGTDENPTYTSLASSVTPTPARNAATITGNVFGGGKGKADTFECEKAMVGEVDSGKGSTSVIIANGTVGTIEDGTLKAGTGNVYGGGEVGRVEKDTEVTIGVAATDAPVILGNVFGAGQGVATHGYSGLVRGDSKVTIQGKSQIQRSVYGGGEMATVGRFYVKGINDGSYEHKDDVKYAHVPAGMPYALISGGKCTVTIKDDVEIGTDDMKMLHLDGQGQVINGEDGLPLPPDDWGHVFGAGKGIIPYENIDEEHNSPGRYYMDGSTYTWQPYGESNEDAYLQFIQTLAIANETELTIGDNVFVKGSVYGGSENGRVLANTHVTIKDDCQIGNGDGVNRRYTTDEWAYDGSSAEKSLPECASWPYGQEVTVGSETKKIYAVYDRLALTTSGHEEEYSDNSSTRGGRHIASDGHTFFGNVFGGGSGLYPYKPGKWHRQAGSVGGNTVVDILGGHILTSVYGGNEHTDVGNYNKDGNNDNEPLIPIAGTGKCTINMTGGTLGVPRTLEQIAAHPVTCYLFGAGKGDQRTFFNTWTNVRETEVNVTGNAHIFGSVFGGGEDGHIIEDAEINIGGTVTVDNTTYNNTGVLIGTTGTSYVDGNVFGAGRGFSGDALTAGSVGGNVEVNISGGTMLGSIYGGGRLASVGIGFNAPDNAQYGSFTEDGPIYYTQAEITAAKEGDPAYGKSTSDIKVPARTYGHVTVNISGGTIGNNSEDDCGDLTKEHTTGGNVFGGSMGRLNLLDGSYNELWPQLGQVKTATVNISQANENVPTLIKSNVYGGGELGTVRDKTYVTIGGTLGDDKTTVTKSGSPVIYRDVFGGGYGSNIFEPDSKATVTASDGTNTLVFGYSPIQWAGCVGQETNVNVYGGWVKRCTYGGGEKASVGIINYLLDETEYDSEADVPAEKVVFRKNPTTNKYSVYQNIVKHADASSSFVLSWPYELSYFPGYPGTTKLNIRGGRLGITDDENEVIKTDNGDVYGGGKGIAGINKDYIFCGNVGSAVINIKYPDGNNATPANYMKDADKVDCIAGAVYGGAENGHVMGDTNVKLENGLIGHALYGGGSGKKKVSTSLLKIGSNAENATEADYYTSDTYSLTAGKVFGNTTVEMSGGYVVRNVFGGGTLGSVGKGNYAGGPDDYTPDGYGEKADGSLWTHSEGFNPDLEIGEGNLPSTLADYFLGSGKCTVKITGGTVGYVASNPSESMKDGLPYGNVFGGCRGVSAPNITDTPHNLYCPDLFVGYANETKVIIGKTRDEFESDAAYETYLSDKAPKILASVYGGGQDGHVRRDTKVIVNCGEIGLPFTNANTSLLGGLTVTDDVTSEVTDNKQWLHRGNVYGGGSGTNKYDASTLQYAAGVTPIPTSDYSTSAGSVTRFTQVDINGGTIHRNVYGGGSMGGVGAPENEKGNILNKKDDSNNDGMQSQCTVNIAGTIGTPIDYQARYGGEVYGASRGLSAESPLGAVVWTKVHVKNGANIQGNVFGGGDAGMVKRDSEVIIGDPAN